MTRTEIVKEDLLGVYVPVGVKPEWGDLLIQEHDAR